MKFENKLKEAMLKQLNQDAKVVNQGHHVIKLVIRFYSDNQFSDFCKDLVTEMSDYVDYRTVVVTINSSIKDAAVKCLHESFDLVERYDGEILDGICNMVNEIPDHDKELVVLEVVGVYGSACPIENSRREKPINLVAKE